MILGVYCLYDCVSKTFGPLSLNQSDNMMIRDFVFKSSKDEFLLKNCKDYILYKIGSYDSSLGVIISDSKVEILNCANLPNLVKGVDND